MTSYSKATNFAAKDALLTGNPSKVVKGTEIDAEFTAIQAADATSLKNGEALGTPSGGTLTNCTGLPVSTGISGLGTGVATFLATPSSANLASAVTGETGSGALVFATSPTLVTPALGTPSSGTLTNCSGLPGTGATFLQAGTGATSRTVQAKLRDVVSVKDFGAVGDGTTDDTAAIQAAIDSGAKKIVGINGDTYKITDNLIIDADSIILDFQQATINLNDATGLKDHIKIGNGTTQRNGVRIRNIIFTRSQAATAGAAIYGYRVGVTEISGCFIYGDSKIFNGIKLMPAIIANVYDNYIQNVVNYGIHVEGLGTGADRTIDISIRENRIEGGVRSLHSWDYVEGLFVRDNIFFNPSGSAVVVDASTNVKGLSSFKFQDCDFDTCGASGLYLDKVNNIQVTGCWLSGTTGTALVLQADTSSAVVSGNQMYPAAIGIDCYGTSAVISGNLISGGTTCIVASSTATYTEIASNSLGNAAYGIDLTTAQNTHVIGNQIFTMSSGTFLNSGGTGTVISNSASGATSLLTSSSSAALTVTQTGSGNAFVVEDSASTDATPFVINAAGVVVAGHTASIPGAFSDEAVVQSVVAGGAAQIAGYRFSANTGGTNVYLYKSRAATAGTNTIVQSGDILGAVNFAGADGTTYHRAATIRGEVDGTPGPNDMPGRLVFSTTADGASSPTERMRIDATGQVTGSASYVAHSATAIPAGGTAGAGLMVSSTANFGVFFGSGAPTLSAAKGSLYLRSDGSTTNDRMYVNTNGSTTWTAVTTAA